MSAIRGPVLVLFSSSLVAANARHRWEVELGDVLAFAGGDSTASNAVPFAVRLANDSHGGS